MSMKRDVARAKNTPGKPSLSEKYKMNTITPRMLAYVAVLVCCLTSLIYLLSVCATSCTDHLQQIRHSLTAGEWANSDLDFDNVEFFDRIVALFDEPLSPWASETLEWWKK